jgi:hypothetical protein
MKNLALTCLALWGFLSLHAQVEISTKSFELESQHKHKGWTIMDAGRDDNNEIYIKFSQPLCDETKNAWTGTRTYKGLKWNIDKLIFDNAFNYQKTDVKHYSSSEEAIQNNEHVFGKVFMPIMAGGVGGALLSGAGLPSKPINNSYMFNTIVVPSVSITGFKIILSGIGCQPLVTDTKTRGTLCGEIPVAETLNSEDAKQEKGQRWIPMYNNPVPNGGNIFFATSGVNKDETKAHYVFRKYNEKASVVKELTITLDYQGLPTIKEIEKAPGVFDYVVIVNPFYYKKSKQPKTEPLKYEYFRIDGETFEIKERIAFTGVYSKWIVENVTEKDGAVYIAGQCSDSKEKYSTFDPYDFKEMNAYQVLKISNGKVDYVNGFNKKDGEAALKIVSGVKGKVGISFVLNSFQVHVINSRLIISGQSVVGISKGNDRDAMVTMVIGSDGKLEAYIAKPEKTYSRGNLYFSKDGNTMYWAIQDVDTYNDITDEGSGSIIAKKYKFIAANLGIVKYNISKNELDSWQSLANEEWALNYTNPFLYDSETETVFVGKKLTKKAKESEIVFISMKK